MGDDTIYSGTVAAATEGYLLGIPAIAMSLASRDFKHYETAARVARDLVERIAARPRRPGAAQCERARRPLRPGAGCRGHAPRAPPQGPARDPGKNPRGETVYWVGPAGAAREAGPGTDFHAVERGAVSVTPLQIDLTHADQIPLSPAGSSGDGPRRHRHDLGTHAAAHGRGAARRRHEGRARAERDGRDPAPRVRRRRHRLARLRGRGAADRPWPDHLQPWHRGADDAAAARGPRR